MKDFNRTLVTAALPYANGPVHIGHLAGCYIPADIYVRFERARKKDILFVGGTDEHGVPITIRARKEGITPQQVVDKYHALIKKSMEQMFISFDIFSRTTNQVHHETASGFFTKLYDENIFEEKRNRTILRRTNEYFSGRPVYHWHLSGLRKPECIRGSVRTLRIFSKSGNAHQSKINPE